MFPIALTSADANGISQFLISSSINGFIFPFGMMDLTQLDVFAILDLLVEGDEMVSTMFSCCYALANTSFALLRW
ncbi:hypothetical protein VNO77_28634 [Canavalia gladiata]|uniref:Uncharacterized protein n=1 Tax=Canavalia gladiata TaxID=3824 RepID=A0AAN9KZH1_CANGL